MGEIAILNHPALLLLFGIAFALCLFDKLQKSTHGLFSLLSAFLAVGSCAYALLLGVGVGEIMTVLLLFLLLNLEGWK